MPWIFQPMRIHSAAHWGNFSMKMKTWFLKDTNPDPQCRVYFVRHVVKCNELFQSVSWLNTISTLFDSEGNKEVAVEPVLKRHSNNIRQALDWTTTCYLRPWHVFLATFLHNLHKLHFHLSRTATCLKRPCFFTKCGECSNHALLYLIAQETAQRGYYFHI